MAVEAHRLAPYCPLHHKARARNTYLEGNRPLQHVVARLPTAFFQGSGPPSIVTMSVPERWISQPEPGHRPQRMWGSRA